jgi:hypothetical protein
VLSTVYIHEVSWVCCTSVFRELVLIVLPDFSKNHGFDVNRWHVSKMLNKNNTKSVAVMTARHRSRDEDDSRILSLKQSNIFIITLKRRSSSTRLQSAISQKAYHLHTHRCENPKSHRTKGNSQNLVFMKHRPTSDNEKYFNIGRIIQQLSQIFQRSLTEAFH